MLIMSDEELVKLGEEAIGPLSHGEFYLMKLVQDKLVELNTVEKKLTTQPLSAKDILHLETKARISFDTKINACEFARLIEKAHGISDER